MGAFSQFGRHRYTNDTQKELCSVHLNYIVPLTFNAYKSNLIQLELLLLFG